MLGHIEQNILVNPRLQDRGIHFIAGILAFDIARSVENNDTRKAQLIDIALQRRFRQITLVRIQVARKLASVFQRTKGAFCIACGVVGIVNERLLLDIGNVLGDLRRHIRES